MANEHIPDICDYEGSTYETDFWEGQGRDYEDRVERVAIRRLMPASGGRLLELGAAYGRLTSLWAGYEQVVLLDYSHSQLETARARYGDEGFLYVAANIYQMPFAPAVFDSATMIRVFHHMPDPPAALRAIRETVRQGGVFLLEFANKQNLKAIARWLLRRQEWSPFTREPVEFAALNYDFHPRYVREELKEAGFEPGRALTVSHFRVGLLKRVVPTGLLVTLDSLAQPTGNLWQLSPSVFVRTEAIGEDASAPAGAFWRCPACGSYDLEEKPDRLACESCGKTWHKRNGVWDFKDAAGD
jgi:ubiquinone/menaquinone biosynthesis C-methylase UbiE